MPIPMRNDQADGLRQMFASACTRFVPVVSNPHVAFGGVMLERLCTSFAERGAKVLVVDAAERASAAGEMAMIELGQCVERLARRSPTSPLVPADPLRRRARPTLLSRARRRSGAGASSLVHRAKSCADFRARPCGAMSMP